MEDTDAQGAGDVLACSHHEVEVLQDDETSYAVDYHATGD